MKRKNTIKKTAALLLGLALAVGGAGCNFVLTDNQKDLAQTVATVNIADSLKNDETYQAYADDVNALIEKISGGKSSAEISKRDLVSYFLSTGYMYVQNYGYSYEDTFNMLMDGLVSREIMIQYAMAYYLKNGEGISLEKCEAYVQAQLDALDDAVPAQKKEKELLQAYPEVLVYKYFLTDGGKAESAAEYDRVVYKLKKSINDSLDSLEKGFIAAAEEEHNHEETRTLPTGVDTEKEDYYTNNYDVYTGRKTWDATNNEYERLDGSTTETRRKAYNGFLANLQSYNLIKVGDKIEDTADITHLEYYYIELTSSLAQNLIVKFNKALENVPVAMLDANNGKYVADKYEEMYAEEERIYSQDPDAFSNAIGSLNKDSFLLYGAKDFGFVYNVLIPFSTSQSVRYTEAKNKGLSEDELYKARAALLQDVKAEDLRGSWISEHDHANYSYVENGEYYFFENSLTKNDQYETLTHYIGGYSYKGTVDDEMVATPTEVPFTTVVDDMVALINEYTGLNVTKRTKSKYYEQESYFDGDEIDYERFILTEGKVEFTKEPTASDHFDERSESYKALSAVNEIMFAYNTDPGIFNTYLGYAISPYSTNFMKEFEYAARKAVAGGVGSYNVVPTDYGWHIIYCSFAYGEEGGKVYGAYDHSQKDIKGTFSNLFYESLKATAISNYTTEIQSDILNTYNVDENVTLYKGAYKDLLNMK